MRALVILVGMTILCGAPGFQRVARSQPQEQRSGAEGVSRTKLLHLRVEFEGNKFVSTHELNERMAKCIHPALEEKGRDASSVVEYCAWYAALGLLRSKGYLQAVVKERELPETGHGLHFVITVEEGTLYRVGEIKVQGAKLFSSEQIMGAAGLRTGEVANGEAITEGLSWRLKKSYDDKGYIQYAYDVEPDFKVSSSGDANEGIVDLTITIDEGQQFLVRRIEFEGNERTPDPVLRRKLLIREGRVYNQQLLEESLRRLNQSGLFEEVTEADVTRRSDGETPELNLTIKVKEKEPF